MQDDMKLQISQAGEKLLSEKNRKKLTVTDIVEECHITRQTFYYHFKDIPDMVLWGMKNKFETVLEMVSDEENPEEILICGLQVFMESKVWIEKIFSTNYRDEVARLFSDSMREAMLECMEKGNMFPEATEVEKKIILNYYVGAFIGVMKDWNEYDTEDIHQIAKLVIDLLSGKIRFFKHDNLE